MTEIGNLQCEIVKHYEVINQVGKKGRCASVEKKKICENLRDLICFHGNRINFAGWELCHVMAYAFLVNAPFHRHGPGSCWELFKRAAQDWILRNHPECVTLLTKGSFAGCYQLQHGNLITHRPSEQWRAPRNSIVRSQSAEQASRAAVA